MDHWSFVFFVCLAGMIVYAGLGLVWIVQYHWGTLASRTFVRNHSAGLVLALGICTFIAGVLVTLDHYGYITMWDLRYALIELHLR